MELSNPTQATGPAACGCSRRPSSPALRRAAGVAVGPPSGVTRGLPVFILSILLFAAVAAACPACESAVSGSQETPGGSARLVRGFARSIYVLMWTPYVLFGGVTFAIVRATRRAKQSPNSEP